MRALSSRQRAVWLLAAAASLWLRTGFPIHAIGESGLDDALFIRLARYLGAGLWLGPLDFTTHVKGVFYPLFILGAFGAGIPLKLAEHIAYLLAAALVAGVAARRGRARVGTVLFVALAFNPVFWTPDLSRVLREGVYLSLSLSLVAGTVALLFPAPLRRAGVGWAVLRGLGLGVLAGAFWLTREEGVWLLPAVGTVAALALLGRTAPLLPTAASILAGVLAFGGCIGGVMAANARVYGAPYTVDVNAPAFRGTYGALSRIGQAQWRRYVVVPRDARLLAYRVSPAARELEPFLDGPVGAFWANTSCQADGAPGCEEILASWFQWALREAVKSAGYYVSLPETDRFYARLAVEIDGACDRGDIPCLPPRATLLPPFRAQFIPEALGRAAVLLPETLRLGGEDSRTQPSVGPEHSIDVFEDTAGLALRRPDPLLVIRGRIGGPAGPAQLAVRPQPGVQTRTEITVTPPQAPDGTAEGLPPQYFEVATDCPPARCDLVMFPGGGGDPIVAPLAGVEAATRIERPGFTLQVQFLREQIARRASNGRVAAMTRVARPIGRAYAAAVPFLAALGLVGVLVALVRRPREAVRSPLFALAAAAAVAVATRVALIAFLDVTSIRSAGILYLSPATPFVLVLAVAGVALLLHVVTRRPLLAAPPVVRMAAGNPGMP